MASAILRTYNPAGIITTAILNHDEKDENESIQLLIGDYEYTFNNEGKLVETTIE